ncbi:MAG: HIT family protein [Gammaproteobacteria bacterium]|nr:HIT family protein [Gammaproteobacteria bacterium]
MELDMRFKKPESEFEIDPRLLDDGIFLGDFDLSKLLLMNNALVPWFVLVPKVEVTEFYQLNATQQASVTREINALSEFLKEELDADKVNVASIGNIVPQLHIHVIGRYHDDFAWPGVVWGHREKEVYQPAEFEALSKRLLDYLNNKINTQ